MINGDLAQRRFRGRWFMTDSYIADAKAFTKLIAQRHSGRADLCFGRKHGRCRDNVLGDRGRDSVDRGRYLVRARGVGP